MKYFIKYDIDGQRNEEEIESENAFQAVTSLVESYRRISFTKIKIITVRTEYEPMCLQVGQTYKTVGGEEVTMIRVVNAGKEYETMVDQNGVNRYSRSNGRIVGRCTGCSIHDPRNIKMGTFFTNHEHKNS